MVPKAKCGCGSAYTRSVAGELVCDVCAQMRSAMRQVQRAERLRELGRILAVQDRPEYRDALIAGAAALERDAATTEYVAQRMRMHKRAGDREGAAS